MKRQLLYLMFLLLNSFIGYSQEIINDPGLDTNEAIVQISVPRINDILSFQTLNQGIGNYAFAQQTGNQNKSAINQMAEAGSGFSNQSHVIQEGNLNEMTVGQIGNGNLMLGFQLGYQSNALSFYPGNLFGFGLGNKIIPAGTPGESNDILASGDRNKLQVTQDGNNNEIIVLQQGADNSISAAQNGNNSYLVILQKGMNNSISGYVQENTNENILFETITQVGEHLSLSATDVSGSKPNGNVFNQSGVNLSLEVNNGLLNTLGGIEINQTGSDMKVVIDQSYFSFPTQ